MGNRWGSDLPPEDAYERHSRGHGRYDEAYAVHPATPGAAAFLVGRSTFEGGASADVAFGRFQAEPVPHCFCDACDETSEDLVGAVERALAVTVGGFDEYGAPRGEHYEVGYLAEDGGSRSETARVTAPPGPWRQRWAPWSRR